ncbi:MAG: hypothetical protein SGCHY_002504 [Lobulomycetales sp.]
MSEHQNNPPTPLGNCFCNCCIPSEQNGHCELNRIGMVNADFGECRSGNACATRFPEQCPVWSQRDFQFTPGIPARPTMMHSGNNIGSDVPATPDHGNGGGAKGIGSIPPTGALSIPPNSLKSKDSKATKASSVKSQGKPSVAATSSSKGPPPIGLIIGLVAAAIILAFIGILLFRSWREKKKQKELDSITAMSSNMAGPSGDKMEKGSSEDGFLEKMKSFKLKPGFTMKKPEPERSFRVLPPRNATMKTISSDAPTVLDPEAGSLTPPLDDSTADYQAQPGYQAEYQPEYEAGYQPEYQDGYQPEYQDGYQPEYQDGYQPEYQDGYQQDYQDGYQPEYQDGYQPEYQDGYQPEQYDQYSHAQNIYTP